MNSSAWYNRLWRRKLENLQVKVDTDQAWANMRQQLDQHMPVDKASVHKYTELLKPATSKIVSFLSYALPVAAMVFTIAYLTVNHKENHKSYKKQEYKKSVSISHLSDSSSVALPANPDTLNSLLQNHNTQHTTLITKNKDTLTQAIWRKYQNAPGNRQSSNSDFNRSSLKKTGHINSQAHSAPSNSGQFTSVYETYLQKNIPNTINGYDEKKPQTTNKNVKTQTELNEGQYNKENAISAKIENAENARQFTIKNTLPILTDSHSGHGVLPASSMEGNPVHQDIASSKRQKSKKGKRLFGFFDNHSSANRVNRASLDYNRGFSYGLKTGYTASNSGPNFYIGGYTSFNINKHWYFNPSVILNSARTLSGSYLHDSYFRPDSIPPFTIADSRKVYFLDLNLNISYRLSKSVSISAGPVISTPIRQASIESKVGNVPDMRDTLMHTQAINASLAKTVFSPKLNMGIVGGVQVQLRRFSIESAYQYNLAPYKISSDLGNYRFNYTSFKIGLGYRLNKVR